MSPRDRTVEGAKCCGSKRIITTETMSRVLGDCVVLECWECTSQSTSSKSASTDLLFVTRQMVVKDYSGFAKNELSKGTKSGTQNCV